GGAKLAVNLAGLLQAFAFLIRPDRFNERTIEQGVPAFGIAGRVQALAHQGNVLVLLAWDQGWTFGNANRLGPVGAPLQLKERFAQTLEAFVLGMQLLQVNIGLARRRDPSQHGLRLELPGMLVEGLRNGRRLKTPALGISRILQNS